MWSPALCLAAVVVCALPLHCVAQEVITPTLSKQRAVFQTDHGDLHLAFYPEQAPETVRHILRLMEMGAYNTNHFFRVDRGFVAQTADVINGRTAALDPFQKAQAEKHVPLEVLPGLKHTKRGILSMARHSDPNSGGSSFSIVLGPHAHLDMQYTVFGEVVEGLETLASMEEVETTKEGIFVMPKERITIHSTYTYIADDATGEPALCSEHLDAARDRQASTAIALENLRRKQLPGN